MSNEVKSTSVITIPSEDELSKEYQAHSTTTHDRGGNVININYELTTDARSFRVEMREVGVKNSTVEIMRGDVLDARGDIRFPVPPDVRRNGGNYEFNLYVVPAL